MSNVPVIAVQTPAIAEPRISVIIPSYNRARVIGAAMASVLDQGIDDFELLVIDDGSRDETLAVVTAVDDPRVGLFQLARNSGAAAARNAGVAQARAPLVAFQDSDDEWQPGLLAAHLAALADADVSFCTLDQRYGSGQTLYPPAGWRLPGDMLGELLAINHISTQTMAIRRDAFQALGGFDTSLPALEDWEFAVRMAAAGLRFAHIDRPLVIAHDSPDSLTRNLARNIKGRELVLARHAGAYAARPALLAHHHHVLGSQYRRLGDTAAACRHFAVALRLRPGQWRSAAQWALAAIGR